MTLPGSDYGHNPLTEAQVLSDLVWAISSPSLVSDPLAINAIGVEVNSIDPVHLLAFLTDQPSPRVGRYFESLVLYWLTYVEQFEIVGHGVQLRQGKRTIGEIDFLFRDHDGELNHWEAAVKFFLHFPRPGQSHYPGPNAVDSFEQKTEKLFEQQLPISDLYYPEVKIRRAFFRGSIFYHGLDVSLQSHSPASVPDRLATNHNRCQWLRCTEVDQLEDLDSNAGFICPKPFWLSAPTAASPAPTQALAHEITRRFERQDQPVMICIVDTETGLETNRIFVVSDDWPLRITQSIHSQSK